MRRHHAFAALSLLTLLLSLGAGTAHAQQAPERRDGDIRVVYSDLTNETLIDVTLELKSPGGEKSPVSLTFSVTYPGKRPAVQPAQVEVWAYVGHLWAPEPHLSLVLDGREAVQFEPPGPAGVYASDTEVIGTILTGIAGTISIGTLRQIVAAQSVRGNALRVGFELTPSQREALARFAARIQQG